MARISFLADERMNKHQYPVSWQARIWIGSVFLISVCDRMAVWVWGADGEAKGSSSTIKRAEPCTLQAVQFRLCWPRCGTV